MSAIRRFSRVLSPRLMLAMFLAPHCPVALAAETASARAMPVGNIDPFAFILLELGVIVIAALVAHLLARRYALPEVLGELLIGIVLGNFLYWFGWSPLFFLIMHLGDAGDLFREVWTSGSSIAEAAAQVFAPEELAADQVGGKLVAALTGPEAPELVLMGIALWVFSNLGVILLLFKLGLQSSLEEMLRIGPQSLAIALAGSFASFLLGLVASLWLLGDSPWSARVLLASTLTASSLRISARVLEDMDKRRASEARLVLGASLIDSVLAMIIVAVAVTSAVTGRTQIHEVGGIILSAVLFFAAVAFLGRRFASLPMPAIYQRNQYHAKLLVPLAVAFFMSWFANTVQLSVIVGAFAAGLILSDQSLGEPGKGKLSIASLITPLEAIFAPIFFVLVGMQVNLLHFLSPPVFGAALVLTIVAVAGKVLAGFAADRNLDRLSMGLALVPRGEVALIIASVAKSLGLITDTLYSAVVVMVIMTMTLTPFALKWSLVQLPTPARS